MHAVRKKYELPRYVVSLHSVEKLQSFVNRLIWHVADCVAYLVAFGVPSLHGLV